MRLTQPFRGWQLAILFGAGFPALAAAQTLDGVTKAQRLEPEQIPRSVVLVGDLPADVTSSEWEHAVSGATRAWNDVGCSFAELTYVGRVDSVDDAPDATPVVFVDGTREPCFALDNDIGWTLFTSCDEWPATTVFLNTNGYEWRSDPDPYGTASVVDLRSVLTHELGHALGLVHEDVTDPLASMAPSYLRDGGLATLAADDKFALCSLYPLDASECDDDSDCAGTCVERDDILACQEIRVAAGDYCDLADLNCGGGAECLVTSPTTYSGYCAPGCEGDDGCPADMRCIEARCLYEAVPLTDQGCATANSNGSYALSWVAMLWASRRRRSRGSPRTP